MSNMEIKDLKYWTIRYGQIEWRLAHLKSQCFQMENDLLKCKEMIKKITFQRSNKKGPSDE